MPPIETVPVVVTASDSDRPDPGADQEVREEVLRLEVARRRKDANEAARHGDFGAAARLLYLGAASIATVPGGAPVADELRRDADAI